MSERTHPSKPVPYIDESWDERMPYCGHTYRECSPECPAWGGRRLADD